MEVHMMGLLEYILLPSIGSTHHKPFEVSKGRYSLPLCQRDGSTGLLLLLWHPGPFHDSVPSQHSGGETGQGLANSYKVLIIRTFSFTLHCSWNNSPCSLILVSLIKEPLEPFALLSAHFYIAHPCWHSASHQAVTCLQEGGSLLSPWNCVFIWETCINTLLSPSFPFLS